MRIAQRTTPHRHRPRCCARARRVSPRTPNATAAAAAAVDDDEEVARDIVAHGIDRDRDRDDRDASSCAERTTNTMRTPRLNPKPY